MRRCFSGSFEEPRRLGWTRRGAARRGFSVQFRSRGIKPKGLRPPLFEKGASVPGPEDTEGFSHPLQHGVRIIYREGICIVIDNIQRRTAALPPPSPALKTPIRYPLGPLLAVLHPSGSTCHISRILRVSKNFSVREREIRQEPRTRGGDGLRDYGRRELRPKKMERRDEHAAK